MKKYLLVVVAISIIPSVAFAAWWNPMSWGIFSFLIQNAPQAQTLSTTTLPNQVIDVATTTVMASSTVETVAPTIQPTPVNRPAKKIVQKTSSPTAPVVATPISSSSATPSSQTCPQGYTCAPTTSIQSQTTTQPNQTPVGAPVSQSTQQQTGYQFCSEQYSNATWDGTSYTSSGGFSCECNSGYTPTKNAYGVQSCQPVGTPYEAINGNCYYPNAYDSNGNQLQTQCPANISQQQQTSIQQPASTGVSAACIQAEQDYQTAENKYATQASIPMAAEISTARLQPYATAVQNALEEEQAACQ